MKTFICYDPDHVMGIGSDVDIAFKNYQQASAAEAYDWEDLVFLQVDSVVQVKEKKVKTEIKIVETILVLKGDKRA